MVMDCKMTPDPLRCESTIHIEHRPAPNAGLSRMDSPRVVARGDAVGGRVAGGWLEVAVGESIAAGLGNSEQHRQQRPSAVASWNFTHFCFSRKVGAVDTDDGLAA